jgi:outer membrane protein OmpA-like peptidoglycan-associated protein
MTVIRATVLAAAVGGAVVGTAATSWAEPIEGLYVGAGAGYNFLQDLTTKVDALDGRTVGAGGVSANAPMKVRWGPGFALDASVGYGLGNGVRLELEGSYRDNNQTHGDGRESQFGVMGNVLYDVDFGLDWMSPYVGIGAGYQAANWHNVTGQASGVDTGSPTSINIDSTQGGFAYQFIVGVAFPIDEVPGLSVTAEYRYMNLAASRSYRAVGTTAGVGGDTRVHAGDDSNHSFLVGLRYAFDGPETSGPVERPPPAPLPAPPAAAEALPAPARTYLVFFDWNSAELSPRAHDIIAEAVRNSARLPHTRIEVTGHADRTGSEHANQVLSERRAQVVAAELEKRGVAASDIDIHAAGDTKPLVPTAAGVRQRENRRVEIVYR